MSENDLRPPVWVGHVVLETDRLDESAQFMRTIGMRPVYQGPEVAIFELRGGTHLILMLKSEVVPGNAPFDLMVDDIRLAHQLFTSQGLAPTPIEAMPSIDHEIFRVSEPAGHVITIFSSHVSGRPV
ncbi:VOC family protein [Collimonas antrihumi]|uniref:VOC family protein n=1 Tax=Collimonas antrihumi TaxID=1940615 RepID=UPI001B8D8BF4|nr:VOC family protein [Collimonas antrihumi]